jgi:sulfatase modifying factor 1
MPTRARRAALTSVVAFALSGACTFGDLNGLQGGGGHRDASPDLGATEPGRADAADSRQATMPDRGTDAVAGGDLEGEQADAPDANGAEHLDVADGGNPESDGGKGEDSRASNPPDVGGSGGIDAAVEGGGVAADGPRLDQAATDTGVAAADVKAGEGDGAPDVEPDAVDSSSLVVMKYGVQGQSCALAGGLTCAASSSCCEQIQIPGGSFAMGTDTDPDKNSDESPMHTAIVDAFWMDKFEVTVGRFRSFVTAFDGTLPTPGSGAHPAHDDSGWQVSFATHMPVSKNDLLAQINCDTGYHYQTWTGSSGVRETMPMNCVSWFVAQSFCIWDGGRLPTEAEWEKAASNGANKTRFPWGNTDPDTTKTAAINCLADGTSACVPADLLPVGSRPGGADSWGILDLAGSLWEWNLDYYDNTYYQLIGTCTNCIDLGGLTPRVVRGGDFTSNQRLVRATERASKTPITTDPWAGFRCVRSH